MKIKGAKKIPNRPVMQEYLSNRNRHELSGDFNYYETGLSKMVSLKKNVRFEWSFEMRSKVNVSSCI